MDLLKVLPVLYLLNCMGCERPILVDKFVKSSPVLDKFCGKYGVCEEGTHVMCMYYDPVNRFGPLCHNPYGNITLHEEQKQFILEVINEVRSRISAGGEKLRDGSELPLGYGVMSVAWDDELAEYAQLWANQCTDQYDICHATSKFPDPGQVILKNRFTIYEWIPVVYKYTKFEDPHVISDEKVNYVIYMTLRKAYHDALQALSPDMIEVNSGEDPVVASEPAVNFLFGIQSHVGCGVSAYMDYEHELDLYDNKIAYQLLRNVVLLVCNYSHRVPLGGKLYNTDKPDGTDDCGCPPGFSGDPYCLCIEDCDTQCKILPDVAILPIFKFEDAPPRKNRKYRNYNKGELAPDFLTITRTPYIEKFVKDNKYDDYVGMMYNNFTSTLKYDQVDFIDTRRHIKLARNADYKRIPTYTKEENTNQNVEENVFDLLNKLDAEVKNIDIGDTEREEIHENIASIYKLVKADIPEQYEYSNGRRNNIPNFYNHNTAVLNRQLLTDSNFYKHNNIVQPQSITNRDTSDKFRNTYDIGQGYHNNYFGRKREDQKNDKVDGLLGYSNREEYRRYNF